MPNWLLVSSTHSPLIRPLPFHHPISSTLIPFIAFILIAGARFVAYVPLPDQKAIEQLVLEKKKADLLAKYTSDSLVKEQEEAKSLLNVRH